jgi:hypothetical protein
MTNSEPSRLDRIEALVESNAKAIEALSNERLEAERRLDRDRARLYQAMAELATAQANLASNQSLYYQRLEETDRKQDELSRRQGEIVQILRLLTDRSQNQSSSAS